MQTAKVASRLPDVAPLELATAIGLDNSICHESK
jgi:hypothetical protein